MQIMFHWHFNCIYIKWNNLYLLYLYFFFIYVSFGFLFSFGVFLISYCHIVLDLDCSHIWTETAKALLLEVPLLWLPSIFQSLPRKITLTFQRGAQPLCLCSPFIALKIDNSSIICDGSFLMWAGVQWACKSSGYFTQVTKP